MFQKGLWYFTEIAQGLLLSPTEEDAAAAAVARDGGAKTVLPHQTLHKPDIGSTLSHLSPSHLKSSHAFSGRLERAGAPVPAAEDTRDPKDIPESEFTGEIALLLQSNIVYGADGLPASSSGHSGSGVLIGVGPHSTALDTPLSWEEPHGYFAECSTRGLYMWSDAGEKYASKVTDTCLIPRSRDVLHKEGDVGVAEGIVRMRWNRDAVWFSVQHGALPPVEGCCPFLGNPGSTRPPNPEDEALKFVPKFPFVTLMSPGDTATIVRESWTRTMPTG